MHNLYQKTVFRVVPFKRRLHLLNICKYYWQWKSPKALIGCLSCPIDSCSPRLQLAMRLGQMKTFRAMLCTLCQKICSFRCITWYSICILVIFPMYFYCFNALPCGPQGVLVANQYQMGSDVDISTSY